VRVLSSFLDGAHLPRAMGERVQKEALRTLAALAYDQTREGRIIPPLTGGLRHPKSPAAPVRATVPARELD